MINEYLPAYLDGDLWEEICQDCYRLRYQSEHYQKIESSHGGDTGIEGFTKTGVVFQSYCPEKEYDTQTLYEHIRDKITRDINKLMKEDNIAKQLKYGVRLIKEWHFVTPKCEDSRILAHLEHHRKRVIEFKKTCGGSDDDNTKNLCNHIDNEFEVVLKIADDFKPELYRLARNRYMDVGLDFTRDHSMQIDFTLCESEKVENVSRKVKAIMDSDDDIRVNMMINYYMSAYLAGIEIIEDLRANFPELHIDLVKLRDSYKNKAMRKTSMNPDSKSNYKIFEKVIDEFEESIKDEFENVITSSAASEICQDIIAGWLADCTMEFVG